MTRGWRAVIAWVCVLWAVAAHAHKPSDSYLTITQAADGFSGRWDIALRDLDFALGLDADGDGAITWGEVRAKHADIAAYAGARLALSAGEQACRLSVGAQMLENHTDGTYSVLPLAIGCGASATQLTVGYTLFADVDPQHRGLLNLRAQGVSRTAVLDPQAPPQRFDLTKANRWSQFADYLREGVWHIWIGFDHILFLLSLLLPAVLIAAPRSGTDPARPPRRSSKVAEPHLLDWRAAHWQPVDDFRTAFWDVFRIVTSFTVAHSITLSLAALHVISLPSRLVEAAIAASVVLAALNNLKPLVQSRRWVVAFGFGLIHGFGFATVLAELGLPGDALVLALVGFNLGVELGQLAIVVLFLPLAYSLRRSKLYRRTLMVGGSLLIALIAAVWFIERAFDLSLLPA
ncbi:MAG TPA: HupE/UreJ family protein [Burkholderiaceae bacterium]|nr:HupE/UreJ family protein [Burkholderiaceae bacterium]